MHAQTIPILPSGDFDVTAGFYGALGFAELGRWPDEYLILKQADVGIELHFWSKPEVERWTNDVACYIRFDCPADAVACHARWAGVAIPESATMSAPAPGVDGSTEFHIIDLHGNLLRLGGFPG